MRFKDARFRGIAVAALGFAVLGGGCSKAKDEASGVNPPASERTETGGAPAAPTETPSAPAGPSTFTGSDTLWNASWTPGEPVATFGDSPRWTETTLAAANRGTTGSPATVVGEVVDVSCYLELGKRGEAHIACATDCVTHGAPIGIVDAENRLFVVMAEEHDPRRYGNVALKEALLPFMAKTVEVTGMLTERDGMNTLYVRGYAVGDDPNHPNGE